MLAVFVNCATILLGSLIGAIFSKKISKAMTDIIQTACGLVSFIMGIQMAFKYQSVICLALSLILGGILGTVADIDGKVLAFGRWLEKAFIHKKNQDSDSEMILAESSSSIQKSKSENSFPYAFLNASVLFCVGAMAIVGSFKAGIEHDYSIIFLKSLLDGFVAIGYTAAMGIGVAFSAISIFLYQGALTLLSVALRPYVSETMIAEITGSGGAIVVMIGINLMALKSPAIKTANYLPAVLISAIFVLLQPIFSGLFPLN